MLSKKQRRFLKKLQTDLHSKFTWISDEEKYGLAEHWGPLPEDFREVEYLNGDCEEFARIACQELRSAGLRARLIYCFVENNLGAHLICECEGWLLDNRFVFPRTIHAARKAGYKLISISGYEAGDTWHYIGRE